MMHDLGFLQGIRELGDLNRLIFDVAELEQAGAVTHQRLQQKLGGSTILAQIVGLDDLVRAGTFFGLVEYDGAEYRNTGLAEALMKANPDHILELQPEQTGLLVNAILFKRTQAAYLAEAAIRHFSYRKHLDRYQHHEYDRGPLKLDPGYRTFLMNLGMLRADGRGIHFIDPAYTDAMREKIRFLRNSDWSEFEPSAEVIRRARECERLVVREERARLRTLGRPDLARDVDWVADYDDRVGYDIQSYHGKRSSKGLHDRFIEVKSNGTDKFSFILTESELAKAREKRRQYWVFYAGEFAIGKPLKKCPTRWIRDPAQSLFDHKSFHFTAKKFRITLLSDPVAASTVSSGPVDPGPPEDP